MSWADFISLVENYIFPITSLFLGVVLLWHPMLLWRTVNVNNMVENWSAKDLVWAKFIGRGLGILVMLTAFMTFNDGVLPRYILFVLR